MTILEKLYQTLQDDNKAKIKVAYTFKPTRPTKEVSFVPFNIPKTRKQASLKGQLSKKLGCKYKTFYKRFSLIHAILGGRRSRRPCLSGFAYVLK